AKICDGSIKYGSSVPLAIETSTGITSPTGCPALATTATSFLGGVRATRFSTGRGRALVAQPGAAAVAKTTAIKVTIALFVIEDMSPWLPIKRWNYQTFKRSTSGHVMSCSCCFHTTRGGHGSSDET